MFSGSLFWAEFRHKHLVTYASSVYGVCTPSEYLAFCEHPNKRPSTRCEGKGNITIACSAERGRRGGADSGNVVGGSVGRFALQYTQIISAVMISLLATAIADAAADAAGERRVRQKCERFALIAQIPTSYLG